MRSVREIAWSPSEEQRTDANIAQFMAKHGLTSYEELQAAWTTDARWFWGTMADELGIVIEAASIGVPDELKGESIWCFVVTADGSAFDEGELRRFVGDRLGKAFTPGRVLAASSLPRTRNGKVLRRAIRSAVTGERPGDLSSLDDPGAIAEIRCAVESTEHVREGR